MDIHNIRFIKLFDHYGNHKNYYYKCPLCKKSNIISVEKFNDFEIMSKLKCNKCNIELTLICKSKGFLGNIIYNFLER